MKLSKTKQRLDDAIDFIDNQLYELGSNTEDRNAQIEAVDLINNYIFKGKVEERWAIDISWDTELDGAIQKISLPKKVKLPFGVGNCNCKNWKNCEDNVESINNYLSDTYGWCIFDYEIIKKIV